MNKKYISKKHRNLEVICNDACRKIKMGAKIMARPSADMARQTHFITLKKLVGSG
jgi:hypothetical protein